VINKWDGVSYEGHDICGITKMNFLDFPYRNLLCNLGQMFIHQTLKNMKQLAQVTKHFFSQNLAQETINY
jgi:hypothetical protein